MFELSIPSLKNSIDRITHAIQGRYTGGLSPAALQLAYCDWLIHLCHSPGKMAEIAENMARKGGDFMTWAALSHHRRDGDAFPFIEPLMDDRRFRAEAWQRYPFNLISQGFLLQEQWWHYATTDIPGLSRHHERVVSFMARQWLDLLSPTNFPATNPEVIDKTVQSGGQNLLDGWSNLLNDTLGRLNATSNNDSEYKVGENLAVTPGKVVYRNPLIELIQYSPTTAEVKPEPILIVPAWIMKYYILDLSPHNSMIKYLVDQGYTVFAISWHNPTEADRDMRLSDYRRFGVMDALKAINAIVPGQSVHATGYCLGGTLLSIAAAAMARDGDKRLKSVTLFASQTDFTEAGELMLFIDESQLSFMEDMMWDQGFLESSQMAGAFTLLHSYDLFWSRLVNDYLLGERGRVNDLMAWNHDTTRMPYKMHTQYLHWLFLNNDLATGRYVVDDRPISLRDIRTPIFAVATENDHIAPWHSVYKIIDLTNTEVTFALTSGGHNAGIVSEPGHPRRHYRIASHQADDRFIAPDDWQLRQQPQEGSWWLAWVDWLDRHSGPAIKPPPLGRADAGYPAICDAPGSYIYES
ncbi:PHA/PHB synthase family protein [Marinobacterium arenosum]|uniref:PHA/PHB synthase family protein n=1 Tax=Marinobacterium arenosum TaxID=2862496 RepID=UPI001C95E378|nr:alpha/beta fold hydrolase [Marinobacterium arenosum]MBY4677423.1 alpha/beta fold hydrolase [Marinobacterium arenosum]